MPPKTNIEVLPTESTCVLRKVGEWHVLEIRGERDVPGYDPAAVARGMTDPQKIRAEVYGDWTSSPGKLVYPQFNPKFHVGERALEFDLDRPLICGWDFGGTAFTGTPAFVPAQLNMFGQLLVWDAVIPEPHQSIGIYEFGEWVAAHLEEEFCHPNGIALKDLQVYHYGDPAGRSKPTANAGADKRAELRSCYEILNLGTKVLIGHDEYRGEPIFDEKPGRGYRIRPGEVTMTRRLEYLRGRLNTITPDGHSAFVIDPGAQYLLDAFQGGYHYKERADGTFEYEPEKNHYSHGVNALEYLVSRLPGAKPLPDEDAEPPGEFRSMTRSPGRRSS